MGREVKESLDYFPLDTVMGTKIKLIEAEFGLVGFAIIVKLYQRIYGERGYYCEWTDEIALLFAGEIKRSYNVVSELIAASLKRGIFDKGMYDKYQILTSRGIQERYFEATSRRIHTKVKKEYLLVSYTQNEINVTEKEVSGNKNEDNVNINETNKKKENKSKEKEMKEDYIYGIRQNVFLTQEQFESLKKKFPDTYQGRIDDFSSKLADKGYKYPNHYDALLKWNYAPQKEVKTFKKTAFNNFASRERTAQEWDEQRRKLLKKQMEILNEKT